MTLIFDDHNTLADMRDYLKKMSKEFPTKFSKREGKNSAAAGCVDLFKQDFSKKLNMNQQELLHRIVAKLIFVD